MLPSPATLALSKAQEETQTSSQIQPSGRKGAISMVQGSESQQPPKAKLHSPLHHHDSALLSSSPLLDMASLLVETLPLMQEDDLLSSFPRIEWDCNLTQEDEKDPALTLKRPSFDPFTAMLPRKKLRLGIVRSQSFSSHLSELEFSSTSCCCHLSHWSYHPDN